MTDLLPVQKEAASREAFADRVAEEKTRRMNHISNFVNEIINATDSSECETPLSPADLGMLIAIVKHEKEMNSHLKILNDEATKVSLNSSKGKLSGLINHKLITLKDYGFFIHITLEKKAKTLVSRVF